MVIFNLSLEFKMLLQNQSQHKNSLSLLSHPWVLEVLENLECLDSLYALDHPLIDTNTFKLFNIISQTDIYHIQ